MVVVVHVIDEEDRQTAVATAYRSIKTIAGKRISVTVEGNVAAVAVIKADLIDVAPSGATTVSALVGKLSPIITAHEEDEVDTYWSFVVDDKY